jgi:hypothetical protein
MGLLDKHNPRATRRSATAWAIGGGVGGGLAGWYGWFRSDLPDAAVFFVVPWMVIGSAVAGWAVEWQLPWDADVERSTEADGGHDAGSS